MQKKNFRYSTKLKNLQSCESIFIMPMLNNYMMNKFKRSIKNY